MDVNGDGNVDILSGSYSREDRDMAGLFQVLWGEGNGKLRAAEVLNGADGEPLILAAGKGEDDDIDKICTRPFAVDLNGDGKLDIVSGNFRGTFGFFVGGGKGKFAPKSTLLETNGKGRPLQVDAHSDPCLVDWDGDGDYDLVSGAAGGGAFLFVNKGSKKTPRFTKPITLLEPVGHGGSGERVLGDNLQQPQAATRVWVDDVDGDRKLDLLIGDNVSLCFPVDGVDEATAKKRLAEWDKKMAKLYQDRERNGSSAADQQQWRQAYDALQAERKTFVRDERTGFVWLLRRK